MWKIAQDLVTKIIKQGRKYHVTINYDVTIVVPYSLFKKRPLEEEMSIDFKEYELWLSENQFSYALGQAVAFLAQRARSEKEIYDKVLRSGCLSRTAEQVIEKLKTMELLDDFDFALQWIESRNRANKSKQKIREELYKKGIESSMFEKAFLAATIEKNNGSAPLSLDDMEFKKALSQSNKLYSRYKGEPRDKVFQKLVQALARRGFTWEIAKKAAENTMATYEDLY